MKLIKISSVWCPSCLIMTPRYNEIKDKYNLDMIEYDYDMDEEVKKYNVGDILPVLIIEEDNKEVIRIIGEKSKKELESIFERIELK